MTREKKELWKKIEQIDLGEEADASFGYWDSSMSEYFDKQRQPYLERLAVLCHFDSVDDMIHDVRCCRCC